MNPRYEMEAQAKQANATGMILSGGASTPMNPTLRENIDQKIQWHADEIERLKIIKEKLPQLLDVNLRDLREAMQF